jgi:hypothetical protein
MQPSSDRPTDEDLIGYLLNGLDDDDRQGLERVLAADSALRQRLEDLSGLLVPIENSKGDVYEPDHSLVKRTMELIEVYNRPPHKPVSQPIVAGLSAVVEAAHRTVRIAWVDSLAVVAAGVTLLCVLLPSVWYAREESRRFACSNNLREIGESLQRFADANPRHQFPKIETQGPMSFAGVYVVKLNEAGLFGSTQWLWCPTNARSSFQVSVPSTSQLMNAPSDLHDSWRRFIGGSYAYNLGVIENGVYRTPCSTESDVPILGDMVCEDDIKANLKPVIHGCNITNILYSDGKVRAIKLPSLTYGDLSSKSPTTKTVVDSITIGDSIDHPYLNRSFINAAGLDTNDWCLGPSYRSPLSGR